MKISKSLLLSSVALMVACCSNPNIRESLVQGVSGVARYVENTEIERYASQLKELESNNEAIRAELLQNRSVQNQVSGTSIGDTVQRRIDHLEARSLANRVQIGETVAKADQVVEPANSVAIRQAERFGYLAPGTTIVVRDTNTPDKAEPAGDHAEETALTTVKSTKSAERLASNTSCRKPVVYVYQLGSAKNGSGCQ